MWAFYFSREFKMKSLLLSVFLNLSAVLIYAFGLIAPLTPSEGYPSLWTMAEFVGVPLVILVVLCFKYASSRWLQLFFVAQIVLILWTFTQLIGLQLGLYPR